MCGVCVCGVVCALCVCVNMCVIVCVWCVGVGVCDVMCLCMCGVCVCMCGVCVCVCGDSSSLDVHPPALCNIFH